jgi:hypothetical protein
VDLEHFIINLSTKVRRTLASSSSLLSYPQQKCNRSFKTRRYAFTKLIVLWICTGFNADPDPDPDPRF